MTMTLAGARELGVRVARLARTIVLRPMPISVHLEGAVLWARFRSRHGVVREHIRENLRAAFSNERSPAEIERVGRRYIAHRHVLNRIGALPGFSDFQGCEVAGVEELEKALTAGRGVVLVSAHLGYPRLIVPILRARGFAISRVAAGPSLVGDIAAGLDVRPIFQALARNESVLMLGDGMHAVQFVKLTLLGNDYPFPTGFMKIAIVSGAPVLPVWSLPGHWRAPVRVEIRPPLELPTGPSLSSKLEVFARLLNEQLQRTPHLWLRWGVPDLFKNAILWSESDLRERKPPKGGWTAHHDSLLYPRSAGRAGPQ